MSAGLQYPALYYAADRASSEAQSRTFLWLGINLAAFIAVSLLSAYAVHAPTPLPWVWFVCGTLLLANFIVTLALAIFKPEQHWFAARAIAESVRTATWRFVCRAQPFRQDSEQAAAAAFTARLREIFHQNERFSARFTDALAGEQLPRMLQERRRLDLAQRKASYRDLRIAEQKKWYADKAASNRTAGRVVMALTLAAMAVATLLHFWRTFDPVWERWHYWPGDATVTLALSVLAWLQARRYQELSETYSIAAQDIAMVEAEVDSVAEEADFSRFVAAAENVFSREHAQWISRKG